MATALVVDDDLRVTALIREQLYLEGFEVTEAQDVHEAWRAVTGEVPDVAIVDIVLRGEADGWSLVSRIRGEARYAHLPVVVLTADASPEASERAGAMGCELVAKPFTAQALAEAVREAIKRATRTVRVTLLLQGATVEGSIHLPHEPRRFSDAWDRVMRSPGAYLAISDAMITPGHAGAADARNRPFLLIRKDGVLGVSPEE